MVIVNGLFVVVGEGGVILTSTNGQSWTRRSSGTTDFLYDVNFGNGKFIAISDTGTVVSSTNGVTWSSSSGGPQDAYGVAYGNSKFVAVGGVYSCPFFCYYYSVTYASADGVTWAQSTPGPSYLLSDVAFGNGKFVAVGDGGTILTSINGTSWSLPVSGASEVLWNVAFGNGTFVVVGGQQGGIFSSTNAVTWTNRNSGTGNGLFNVAYANGTFLAVGLNGTIRQSDPVVPPPRLAISVAGSSLRFSWPLAAGAFSLQEADNLSTPAWSPTPNQMATNVGDQTIVTVAVPTANRFYRLVR